MTVLRIGTLATLGLAIVALSGEAQERYRMTTPVPAEITTPDTVDTRIGTLKFFDGVPTKETAAMVYCHRAHQRPALHLTNG